MGRALGWGDARCLTINAVARGAGAGLLAIVLAGAAGPAFADPYCGPGRHVGSENDGTGKSWTCVPDGVVGSPTGRQYVFQGGAVQANRVAAGMALGAAGAELVGALVGILGSSQRSGPTEEELRAAEQRRRIDQEWEANKAAANVEAAAYRDEGLKAAQASNYLGAFNAFKHAYERNSDYGSLRDMKAMEALLHLQEALALTAEKKTAPAYTEFFKAEALAREASRPDISQRIEAYRTRLFADIKDSQKTAPGATKPTTKCVSVNGDFVCD
ncbi:MAG: hypothetical protein J0J01_07710 [Reyranella sp.]|uniref:hypothetical protein n=1 Tax=Reyranella sp. TaxID=1929291 RepID=UPI001ACA7B7B|nr:hypothetical protein [Reyranella sp.]MBN9086777.1 hypothetical protein [Reyranella sp.]